MNNKIYVVGFGPGDESQITNQARNAIVESDIVIGYTLYVELIEKSFPNKKYLSTPMKKEVERCKLALETAREGNKVAFVCSGDAGVYGMASLILELQEDFKDVEVEIVPGLTAATAGAAVLGAPINHDFAVISLSDLLTPWEKIEKRLSCAADADLVICLYNPSSMKRHDYLQKACDILLKFKSSDTICGYVKNIARKGESKKILTLQELRNEQVDMFTTVFVGNSQTRNIGENMVTPRGYKI